MAGEVTSAIAAEAAKTGVQEATSAVCWLSRQARYCYDFNTYNNHFSAAKDEFIATKQNLEDLVNKGNERLQKTGDLVTEQLEKARILGEEAEQLTKDVQNKRDCPCGCPDLICRYFLSRRVEQMKLKLEMEARKEKSTIINFKRFQRRESLKYMDTSGDFLDSRSAEEAYRKLLEALKNETVNRIGLHGMGGCGKTTLLKKLRSEVQNSNPFDKVAYVVVSKNLVIEEIQVSIANCLNLNFDEGERVSERATRLQMGICYNKRVLIILDDVWQDLDYEAIGIPGSKHTDCTVLIATRREDLCFRMKCEPMIPIELLTEDEAWDLFKIHAGITNEDSDILSQAKEICNKCERLPIAIVAVAKSLIGKTPGDWNVALNKLKVREPVDIEAGLENPYKCLISSYDNLNDEEAQKLFLLCSLFPEDSEVQVEYLIRSAIGLGIFQKFDPFEYKRSKADSTIHRLIQSSLLLKGDKGRSVLMHDLFRTVALMIANNSINLIMGSGKDGKEFAKNAIAEDIVRYLYCHNIDEFPDQLNVPKLEILFVFKEGKCSSQEEEDGECSLKVSDTFFRGMKELRVLTVIYRSSQKASTLLLPSSVKFLTNLRTLCLKRCKLNEMDFLKKLEKLETIEFYECTIADLSYQIAELQNLRLLDVSRCCIRGNPYEVLGSCSHLQELYFLENQLPEVVPGNQNLSDFFKNKKGSSPKLQRYHLQIGSNMDDIKGDSEIRSKILSISHFALFNSNATIEDLVGRTEILFLKNIRGGGGCKSMIPDLVQTGGMNALIELLLCELDEIECVIDATSNLCEVGNVFSELNKLSITMMEHLQTLCRGQPLPVLFGKLKELQISKCSQMHGMLFVGKIILPCLEVLELKECPRLTSLFTLVIAQSMEKIQVIKITNCNQLKHIIAEEQEENLTVGDVVFPNLERLQVTYCQQLEFLIPVSLAQGLQHLESLLICEASNLKYLFGEYNNHADQSSNQCRNNEPQIIELPCLKNLELVDLRSIIKICSENHNLSCQSLDKPHVSGCPDNFRTAVLRMAGLESEERQRCHQTHHNTKKQVKADISISTAAAVGKDSQHQTKLQVRYSLCFNNSIDDFVKEKEELMLVMSTIQDRAADAKRRGELIATDVERWLEKASILTEEAEELEEKLKRRKRCLSWVWPSNVGKLVDQKRKEMIELNENTIFRLFASRATFPTIEYIHNENFVDFESTKLASDRLFWALKDDQVSMIGLYGLRGCGKTTLVKMLASKAEESGFFDHVAMATVGRTPNIRRIQGVIADQLGLMFEEESEILRARRLSMRLHKEKRSLIIFDDLWTELNLETIGIPFGRNHDVSCCVLLTAPRLQVCHLMGCDVTIPLSNLTEEEAWILFVKHARLTDDIPDTMMRLAKEIARACAGLPLAIVTVARSLRGTTRANWEAALDTLTGSVFIDVEEHERKIFGSLNLSYDYLPSVEVQSLFMLCSVFPENYEIPIEILIRYGISLGEYENLDLGRSGLHRALDMLLDSSLLEHHGRGCVKMHDLVRDVALYIAYHEKFKGGIRYLWCDKVNKSPDQLDLKKQTFLYIQQDLEHVQLDEHFKVMEELRLLVLRNDDGGIISALPLSNSTEWLKNLRCLVLDGWELGDFYFTQSLRRLEALTLRRCSFDELPSGLLRLTKLRLLDLSYCKIETEPYQLIGRCSQLQELYFTRCHNSKWKLQDDNFAQLSGENSNLHLERYHIEVGETLGLFDRVDYSVSRGLSVQYFDTSASNPTTNDLIQKAEVLFLKEITGGCKNIIPDILQTGGMDELIELLVCNSEEIECLIDSTNFSLRDRVFSGLLKLTIESMKNVEFLCRGQPSLDLFARLEELHMKSCYQMRGILSAGGLNLSGLTVMELHDCPMLISLFTPAIAQTLLLLEVLKVTQCDGIKCIVAADEEKKKDEIVSLEQNSHGLEFKKLKQIVIQNCKQLEYVFGQYNHEGQSSYQNGKKVMKIIELPVLNQLRLEQLPNMVAIFPGNYNIKWPQLHDFYLLDCPRLIMGAISNCTVGTELRQLDTVTTKDAMCIKNLGSLTVKSSQLESIFHLDGFPAGGEPVTSGLTLLDLYLLPELSYICKGPKNFLSLQKLEELQIEGCGKLKFVFSTSITRSLSHLKILKIINCQELVQITEEDVENQVGLSNHDFGDVCFPQLIILFVSNCNKLKRLISVSTSHEFLKLKSLIIMGAFKLKEVFGREKGEEYEDVELVLPNLEHLILTELPCLVHVSPGIQLKNVEHWFVHDCPKFTLNSNITDLEDLCQKVKGEGTEIIDNGYGCGPHGELLRTLQTIEYNKNSIPETTSHHQMDPNDRDSLQASSESGYNQNDSGIAPIVSPNLTKNTKQTVKETLGGTSTDSKLESPAVPLHETTPKNRETVEQIVQEPKNSLLAPSPEQSAQEFMDKKSRNEGTKTDQKALEEIGSQIHSNDSQNGIKDIVLESPRSQKVSMIASTTHDSEPRSSMLKHRFEKSPEEMVGMMSSNDTIITNEQNIDGSSQRGSQASIIASSTDSEPGTLINSQQELVGKESMGAPVSLEQGALGQNKINNEFPQIVDKPSASCDLVQNVEEHASATTSITISNKTAMASPLTIPELEDSALTSIVTSPRKILHSDRIRIHQTGTCTNEDVEADPIDLQDFKNDYLITLLQSMEDNDDVRVSVPSVSRTSAELPFPKDKKLTQAIANLEASLKMPLNDIANSEDSILHLEMTLCYLSSHCWEDEALFDGLKATIDTLHQDFPIILSSYKKASTTIEKFKEIEEKVKSIKEKHPQRMEAAVTLVSDILKTKKDMTEAQQKEIDLKEQISQLLVELEKTQRKTKDYKVSLSSLEEQNKQFCDNAVRLKNEFETVKNVRSEMFQDQTNAQRELVQMDNEWSALCGQFEENLVAARNLS